MGFFNKFKKPKTSCPYCGLPLDPVPKRKKKCPSCGRFIYVRTRPSDRQRILATEEDAKRIDEEWEKIGDEREYKQLLERFNISQKEYLNIKKELFRKFKTAPSRRDIFWTILNNKLLEAMKNKGWDKMSGLYFEQALFLKEEGKNPFSVLKESKRCELRNYVSSGVKEVQILSAGDSSCGKCKVLNGKIFTIKEALGTMPIPIDNCDNSYRYCRCVYLPVVN